MHMCLRARQRQQVDRASRAGAAQSSVGGPCGRRADRWKAACATEAVSQAHAQEQTLLVACLQLSVHRLEAGGAGPAWPMQQRGERPGSRMILPSVLFQRWALFLGCCLAL